MIPIPGKRQSRLALRGVAACGLVLVALVSPVFAQAGDSAAVAKELVQVMEAKKLDAIAARLPDSQSVYMAALYFPNVQLLVVSGDYPAPQLMEPRLTEKQYRDIYAELSGTVPPDTKIFVQDMGQPGLTSRTQNSMFDTWNKGGKIVMFNGENDEQKMSDAEYQKAYASADAEYARILSALLAEAKK